MQILLTEEEYEKLRYKAKRWDEYEERRNGSEKSRPLAGTTYVCPFCDTKITVSNGESDIAICPSCMRRLKIQ